MKKCKDSPTKQAIEFEFAMRKWSENDVIAVALYASIMHVVNVQTSMDGSHLNIDGVCGLSFSIQSPCYCHSTRIGLTCVVHMEESVSQISCTKNSVCMNSYISIVSSLFSLSFSLSSSIASPSSLTSNYLSIVDQCIRMKSIDSHHIKKSTLKQL